MSKSMIRDEIEEVIKQEKINRERFGEFSKFKYEDIIKKFYYAFADYLHFASAATVLERKRLHIRSDVAHFAITGIYTEGNWTEYLEAIKSAMPVLESCFLILSEGWVYEGYADEMIQALQKTDAWRADFFIVSKKFDWFIAHDFVDWCAFMYRK